MAQRGDIAYATHRNRHPPGLQPSTLASCTAPRSPVWVPSLTPLPTITGLTWKGNWPGPPDGHPMTTTLNCAASTHRSSEGAGSHRTTRSASTPGVAHERVLGDVEHRVPVPGQGGCRVLILVAARQSGGAICRCLRFAVRPLVGPRAVVMRSVYLQILGFSADHNLAICRAREGRAPRPGQVSGPSKQR